MKAEIVRNNVTVLLHCPDANYGVDSEGRLYTIDSWNILGRLIAWICDFLGDRLRETVRETLIAMGKKFTHHVKEISHFTDAMNAYKSPQSSSQKRRLPIALATHFRRNGPPKHLKGYLFSHTQSSPHDSRVVMSYPEIAVYIAELPQFIHDGAIWGPASDLIVYARCRKIFTSNLMT